VTTAKGPTCELCEKKPATCFGAYEMQEGETFACDDCCGHGNEDGWCRPVSEHPNNPANILEECDKCDGTGTVEGIGRCWHCGGAGVFDPHGTSERSNP
jgi:hypothetical protein